MHHIKPSIGVGFKILLWAPLFFPLDGQTKGGVVVGTTVPKDLNQVNIDFFLNERIYLIAPSSLHGLELFSMDGIKICDGGLDELMEYVKPFYIYKY